MTTFIHQPTTLFLLGILLHLLCFAKSQSLIGVNYGQEINKLPKPDDVVNLLKQTIIKNIRLLGNDVYAIKALENTDIGIIISAGNGDIVGLGASPTVAYGWVRTLVQMYFPESKIIAVSIGNEVVNTGDQNQMSSLLPAMRNFQNSLNEVKVGDRIKVSTVFTMAALAKSDPPSTATFDPAYLPQIQEVVKFLRENGSPFMIDVFPYHAYQSNPTPEMLKYCLFQDTVGKIDPGNNLKYMNMFDAQVDAVRTALNALQASDIPIIISATGWPSQGDPSEPAATVENAKAYNGNLIKHLNSNLGTPLSPNKPLNTFISTLFDEDRRTGPKSLSSYGLFKPDFTPNYDIGVVTGTIPKPAPLADPMSDPANWFNLKSGPPDGVVV